MSTLPASTQEMPVDCSATITPTRPSMAQRECWSSHSRKRTMSNASLKGCGGESRNGGNRGMGQRRVIATVEACPDGRAPETRVTRKPARRDETDARRFRSRRKPARRRRARSRRRRARVRDRTRSEPMDRKSASRGVRHELARRLSIRDARFARRFPGASGGAEIDIARARDARKRVSYVPRWCARWARCPPSSACR